MREATDCGIILLNLETLDIIEADCGFYTLLGYSKDDFQDEKTIHFYDHIYRDDYQPMRDEIAHQLETGDYFNITHRALTANGEIISVRCYASAVKDEKINCLYRCFYRNVTLNERKGLSVLKKRANEALQMSYDNIRNILQTIPSMIYVVSKETHEVVFFNDATAQTFPDIAVGKRCYETVGIGKGDLYDDASDESVCAGCILKDINTAHEYPDTFKVTLNGKKRRYDRNLSYILWENKIPSYILMLNPHIETEEERKLRKQQTMLQQKYAFIYRHSCDYIVDIDVNLRLIRISIVNTELSFEIPELGEDFDETFSIICEKYVHRDDREKVRNIFSLDSLVMIYRSGTTSFVEEFRIVTSAGETRWNEYRVFFLENQDDYSIVVSCRDITENRIIEEENRIEKKRLYTVLSNVYVMVVYLNLTQNIYTVKSMDTDIVQKIPSDGRYNEFFDVCKGRVFADDEVNLEVFSLSKLTEKFSSGVEGLYTVVRLQTKKDEFHWLSVMMKSAGTNAAGDILAVGMIKLIDSEKQSEQALQQARIAAEEANKAKSDFLARMSHDIRTPMNAIIGMTSIAMNNLDNRPKVEDCLRKSQISSKFLLSLINEILDMSRIESGRLAIEPGKMNLNDFVEEIVEIIKPQTKEKNIEFTVERSSIASIFLIADSFRIKQVIINLLSNALKFTGKNGKILFEIQQKPLSDTSITMCFGVRDNGIGMSAKTLATIFEPFTQGKNTVSTYGGSGLGLSICLNLVKLMDGTINVRSTEQSGTYFYVEIPLEIDRQMDRRNRPRFDGSFTDSTFTLEGKRVLLAEDDMINTEIAQTVLEEKGIIVTVAEDGKQALDIFATPENTFDAILMDVHMPVMDGLTATSEIRKLSRPDAQTVPIIAMTANAFAEDVSECMAHGMNGHLSKPIEPKKVYEKLTEMMKTAKKPI